MSDEDEDDERPPYWLLISVLFSSVPLESGVAWTLYGAACDLLSAGEGEAQLHTDQASGTLRRLGKDVLVGTLGGPAFEAEISTPDAKDASVRFFVTRQGVELHERRQPRPRRGQLN